MIPRNLNRKTRFSICKATNLEEKVQSGLALTPAEMYTLSQQGKPIAANVLPDDYFDDGQQFCTNEIPLDRQRGIDVVDMWEAEKQINNKFNDFKKKGVQHVTNGQDAQ